MATRIEVTGLNEAKDNFKKLGALVEKEIGREALRAMGWALARPMRAATYTTFTRRTGGIKTGLSVSVQRDSKSDKLTGYVEEYAQPISGLTPSPFAALVRKRSNAKRHRKVDTSSVAFYWRFLELGTGPRRATRTPSFLRSGKIGSTAARQGRQLSSVQHWLAAPSRGGIKSRRWIRPIYGSKAPDAINSFRATILKLIDAAVGDMPKK